MFSTQGLTKPTGDANLKRICNQCGADYYIKHSWSSGKIACPVCRHSQ